MKANVNLAASTDFRTSLDREAETHLRCARTEDHKEGVRALFGRLVSNKRKASWNWGPLWTTMSLV